MDNNQKLNYIVQLERRAKIKIIIIGVVVVVVIGLGMIFSQYKNMS